jgi:phosphoglycolate phosphatase-like HAD superfamily hydrolase
LAEIHKDEKDFRRFYGLLKRFLHPAEKVGESIISTVFEEFFCGTRLFREIYGMTPEFNSGPGLIENERLIVRPETLDSLVSILGKRNLGIASGSRRKSAEYVLGSLIEKFNPRSLVFAETVETAERERPGGTNLKKPHPFPLLKAAEGFGNCGFLMYVGDSAEDFLMANEAARVRGGVLFAGVYSYSCVEEEKLRGFLDFGCDMVIPSVNELPVILRRLGRKGR